MRVGPPEGQHTVVVEALTDQDGDVIATAQTWFVAAAAPPSSSLPGVPGPNPAPPQRVVVSDAESGRSITMPPGSTTELAFLDASWRWTRFVYDSYVLQLDSAPGVFPALFRARNPGTTTITSTGSLPCRDASPPCMTPDRLFQLYVTVQ